MDKARETLVVEPPREASISRGLAARLLGLTPWQMMDVIAGRMPIASRLLVLMIGVHISALASRSAVLPWR